MGNIEKTITKVWTGLLPPVTMVNPKLKRGGFLGQSTGFEVVPADRLPKSTTEDGINLIAESARRIEATATNLSPAPITTLERRDEAHRLSPTMVGQIFPSLGHIKPKEIAKVFSTSPSDLGSQIVRSGMGFLEWLHTYLPPELLNRLSLTTQVAVSESLPDIYRQLQTGIPRQMHEAAVILAAGRTAQLVDLTKTHSGADLFRLTEKTLGERFSQPINVNIPVLYRRDRSGKLILSRIGPEVEMTDMQLQRIARRHDVSMHPSDRFDEKVVFQLAVRPLTDLHPSTDVLNDITSLNNLGWLALPPGRAKSEESATLKFMRGRGLTDEHFLSDRWGVRLVVGSSDYIPLLGHKLKRKIFPEDEGWNLALPTDPPNPSSVLQYPKYCLTNENFPGDVVEMQIFYLQGSLIIPGFGPYNACLLDPEASTGVYKAERQISPFLPILYPPEFNGIDWDNEDIRRRIRENAFELTLLGKI